MIELATETNVPRLSTNEEFDELSNYLGRFIKIDGISINSLGQIASESVFSRAGKLIAVSGRGRMRDSRDTATGITIESYPKIDLNFQSSTLKISILQSDAGVWKVIHAPLKRKR